MKHYTVFPYKYFQGILIKEKNKIAQNYLKQDLVCDLLSLLPLLINIYLFLNPFATSMFFKLRGLFQILIFFKFFEFKRTTRFLEETLNLSDKNFAILQLIKMGIAIFLFSNIMACLWHIICLYPSEENNLLKFQKYYDKEWQSRYLRCLFWTVNPGRVDPQNDLENLFGFFALLATSGSMGFMISGIHNLMRVLGKNSDQNR